MIKQLTETPLDCLCKGDGIIHKTKKPCPKHFLYARDEEFRAVSLNLYAESFKAVIIHLISNSPVLERHREVGFPQTTEFLDEFVKLFWNPQNIEEELRALQIFVRLITDYISKIELTKPQASSVDLFSTFGEFQLDLGSQFMWKPLYTDEQ